MFPAAPHCGLIRYYQTKFDNKRISSSEDIVERVIVDHMIHCCDLGLKTAKNFFLHDTLAHDATSQYQVWQQNVCWFRSIIWTNIDIGPFAVTLTLIAVIQFFTEHSGLWCCITTPSLVTKCSVVQKISSRQTFTDILNLCCDLDLECSNPVFHRTLQLMMLYYWNKFGCKWTSSLEDIVKTVIFWLCKPLLWPSHWR